MAAHGEECENLKQNGLSSKAAVTNSQMEGKHSGTAFTVLLADPCPVSGKNVIIFPSGNLCSLLYSTDRGQDGDALRWFYENYKEPVQNQLYEELVSELVWFPTAIEPCHYINLNISFSGPWCPMSVFWVFEDMSAGIQFADLHRSHNFSCFSCKPVS